MEQIRDDLTMVTALGGQMSAQLPGETVILNEGSGVYYGLQGIGIRVWELIQQPRLIGEIVDILVQEYDVAKERCREDVVALLEEMAERGLVALEYGSDTEVP